MRKNKYTMKQRVEASGKVINLYRDEISKLYDFIKENGLIDEYRDFRALKELQEINERKSTRKKLKNIPYNVLVKRGEENVDEESN